MRIRTLALCLVVLGLGATPPAFVKAGKGPGILLVHGFGGNKEVWSATAAELSRDHTVLSVDLPGSGGTAGPALVEGRADLGSIARELAALVRKEGLVPCLIVGHSMGGPIAARTALEDPASFRGVVLADGFLGAIPPAEFEPTISGLAKDPQTALSAFYGPMTTGTAQNARVVREALGIPVPILQAYLRSLTVDPLQGRKAELRLPILQVAAGPVETDPAKAAGYLAEYGFGNVPSLHIVHLPQAKHWVMWDMPEAFLIALRAFEAGLGR